MIFRSLADIDALIRSSWSEETCDPVVTALVVQDLLGGELVLGEVYNADGSRQDLSVGRLAAQYQALSGEVRARLRPMSLDV